MKSTNKIPPQSKLKIAKIKALNKKLKKLNQKMDKLEEQHEAIKSDVYATSESVSILTNELMSELSGVVSNKVIDEIMEKL
jgi:predicted  nucleic acid-binding Zn-ribbon protein